MRVTLTLMDGLQTTDGEKICPVDVGEDGFVIGRGLEADLTVTLPGHPESGVSRRHVELRDSNGDLIAVDLSKFGTALDRKGQGRGQKLSPSTPVTMPDDCILIFPTGRVRVRVNRPPKVEDDWEIEDIMKERRARHQTAPGTSDGVVDDLLTGAAPPEVPTPRTPPTAQERQARRSGDALEAVRKSEVPPPSAQPIPNDLADLLGIDYDQQPADQPNGDGNVMPNTLNDLLASDDDQDAPDPLEPPLVPGQQDTPEEAPPRDLDPALSADSDPVSTVDASSGAAAEALEALLRGVGQSIDDIPDEELTPFCADLGKVFAELADAARLMLMTRAEMKSKLGINSSEVDGSNPLKLVTSRQDAIEGLLRPRVSGYLSGVPAVIDARESMQHHQEALTSGIKLALDRVIAEFDPDKIEKVAELGTMARAFSSLRKAALWDIFVENYEEFSEDAERRFRKIMREELSPLYRDARGNRFK